MELKTFMKKVETIKKGQFFNAQWKSNKVVNGVECTKISNGVVRVVHYGNINGVEVKGKINPNEKVLIENLLYKNTKTNNILVQFATTDVKSKVSYYINNQETTKENYELMVKPNPNKEKPVVFRIKLENLISIGE